MLKLDTSSRQDIVDEDAGVGRHLHSQHGNGVPFLITEVLHHRDDVIQEVIVDGSNLNCDGRGRGGCPSPKPKPVLSQLPVQLADDLYLIQLKR